MNDPADRTDASSAADDRVAGEAERGDARAFDFTFAPGVARIAIYDDLLSAPHMIEIPPAETGAYIENIASTIYEQARRAGGVIPYTVIREVSENFIHARFKEIVVSILDRGNTIRFADQGPGILHKDKAQEPGFSSAIEPMKDYIRGVGSGLPIVKEYLESSHGTISIEDNMGTGSVVTISLNQQHGDEDEVEGEEFPEQTDAFEGSYGAAGVYGSAGHASGDPLARGMAGSFNAMNQTHYAEGGAYPQHAAAYNGQPSAAAYPGQSFDPRFAQQGYPAGGYGMPRAPYAGTSYPQHPAAGTPAQGYPAAGYPAAQGYYSPEQQASFQAVRIRQATTDLSEKERVCLVLLANEGPLGITELSALTGMAPSSTSATLKKLEERGLAEKLPSKKRQLTPMGNDVALTLS